MAALATGCQPILKPDMSYPADWPALTVLTAGFAELAGTYANDGTATTATGSTVPVRLAGLFPEGARVRPAAAAGDAASGKESVTLEITPPRGLSPYPHLRATVTTRHGVSVCEVDAGTDKSYLLYLLQTDGRTAGVVGFDAGQMVIMLTKGEDGSLIAKITEDPSTVSLVEPTDARSTVWARFGRISP